jgi:hypothetical protein
MAERLEQAQRAGWFGTHAIVGAADADCRNPEG